MKAEYIIEAIRTLDERQGRLWNEYHERANDDEIEGIFSKVDQIDLERRRLVGYHKAVFGSLPDGMTEVY